MGVTVIHPGRLVKVEPDEIDEKDTLEVAEAMIEEQGHIQGDSGDENRGWSIHGAIGEAARRVTDSQGKDNSEPRALRDAAAQLLLDHHQASEIVLNDDPGTTKDRAISLMREARLGIPSTFSVTQPAPTSQAAGQGPTTTPTTPGDAT